MSLPFEISPEELDSLRRSEHPPVLIDVREPDEFDTAKIEGARLLPLGDFAQLHVAELPDLHAHIVVHCHHGMRSARAVQFLQAHGYTRVQNLAGGIDAWSEKIDPQVPTY